MSWCLQQEHMQSRYCGSVYVSKSSASRFPCRDLNALATLASLKGTLVTQESFRVRASCLSQVKIERSSRFICLAQRQHLTFSGLEHQLSSQSCIMLDIHPAPLIEPAPKAKLTGPLATPFQEAGIILSRDQPLGLPPPI
jgi:hypothetical protein